MNRHRKSISAFKFVGMIFLASANEMLGAAKHLCSNEDTYHLQILVPNTISSAGQNQGPQGSGQPQG